MAQLTRMERYDLLTSVFLHQPIMRGGNIEVPHGSVIDCFMEHGFKVLPSTPSSSIASEIGFRWPQ
ncbi:MAG: hypothetical protein OXL40_14265 [Bacteroidota bacterium]|nr:hypothetical protein [Bacteroidota bacterium]